MRLKKQSRRPTHGRLNSTQLKSRRHTCGLEQLEERQLLTTFVFNPAPEMLQEAIDGFQLAADQWEQLLFDDVTVFLDIDLAPLDMETLGFATSNSEEFSYAEVRQALVDDAISEDDNMAIANLQPGPAISLYINHTQDNPNGVGSDVPYLDDDGGANNTTLNVNTASAKALGLETTVETDGEIVFNSESTFDFDPSDGIDPGAVDFVGMAMHEIGHVLGFTSGVDELVEILTLDESVNDDDIVQVSPWDLFRFSTESLSLGDGTIDFTADIRDKFFSVDNGTTELGTFSTGVNEEFGDGFEASHWKDLDPVLGLMSPVSVAGFAAEILELDLRAFDVIGWNREEIDPDLGAEWGDPGDRPPLDTSTRTIVVNGYVYEDGNGNGALDVGESGVGGVSVWRDVDGNGWQNFGEPGSVSNEVGFWQITTDIDPPEYPSNDDVDSLDDPSNGDTDPLEFPSNGDGVRPLLDIRMAVPPGTVANAPPETTVEDATVRLLETNPPRNHTDVNFFIQSNFDYGDAPETGLSTFFPTIYPSNGASHGIISNFFLGNTVDADPVGQPGEGALGDDDDADGDDDDGVFFTAGDPLIAGQEVTVTVIGGPAASSGLFQMWIDVDHNGDWDGMDEQVIHNKRLSPGENSLTFTVPVGIVAGTTYARARLGFEQNLGPEGHSLGGEVEDYAIVLGETGPGPLVTRITDDLGVITFLELPDHKISPESVYELTAGHSGTLTVEALLEETNTEIELRVFNQTGTLLGVSSAVSNGYRIDVPVSVNDHLFLSFGGAAATVDLRMANLLVGHGEDLFIYGTDQNDLFTLATGEQNQISVNGVDYRLDAKNLDSITYYSGNGQDQVDVGNGWIAQGTRKYLRHDVDVFTHGDTTLRISTTMPVTKVGLLGDLATDGVLAASDIDKIYSALETGETDEALDLNRDGQVGIEDVYFLLQDLLHTTRGDVDLSGAVDVVDYDSLAVNFDPHATNRIWVQGDFDGDGDADFTDFRNVFLNYSIAETVQRPQSANAGRFLIYQEPEVKPVVEGFAGDRLSPSDILMQHRITSQGFSELRSNTSRQAVLSEVPFGNVTASHSSLTINDATIDVLETPMEQERFISTQNSVSVADLLVDAGHGSGGDTDVFQRQNDLRSDETDLDGDEI